MVQHPVRSGESRGSIPRVLTSSVTQVAESRFLPGEMGVRLLPEESNAEHVAGSPGCKPDASGRGGSTPSVGTALAGVSGARPPKLSDAGSTPAGRALDWTVCSC